MINLIPVIINLKENQQASVVNLAIRSTPVRTVSQEGSQHTSFRRFYPLKFETLKNAKGINSY
jgi:hypothetical protein